MYINADKEYVIKPGKAIFMPIDYDTPTGYVPVVLTAPHLMEHHCSVALSKRGILVINHGEYERTITPGELIAEIEFVRKYKPRKK